VIKVIAWLCENVDGLLEGKIGKNSEEVSLTFILLMWRIG
jgi:hypothetical protein